MKGAEEVTFGGSGLDRAAQCRGKPEEIARLMADPSARLLPLWRGKPLMAEDTGGWLPVDHSIRADAMEGPIFLGLDEGAPRFACDISTWEPDEVPETLGTFLDPSEQCHPALPSELRFAELRSHMTLLSPREAELLATAKAVTGWHATHGFCARCGVKTTPAQSGWQRDCPACGAHHFPRTDPVVIMLITHGNSVLMGRSGFWPEGMYSLLAGFVEPGETIEAAVRREVFGEAGIRVGEVGYLASQPWPFPASLMIGCRGAALGREITIDPVELEDALWVPRQEMLDAMTGNHPKIKPGRQGAIARFLIDRWLADRLD
jgi:NAD+ diphosphatase